MFLQSAKRQHFRSETQTALFSARALLFDIQVSIGDTDSRQTENETPVDSRHGLERTVEHFLGPNARRALCPIVAVFKGTPYKHNRPKPHKWQQQKASPRALPSRRGEEGLPEVQSPTEGKFKRAT